MSLFRDTTYRSEELELMDDFSIQGDLLRDTLDQLGRINKWLGGNRITLDGIRALLNGQSKKRKFTIVDLGCGHGDMLRKVADFGRANGYQFKLIGIDANVDAIAYANQLSQSYEEIFYLSWDIFSDEFKALRCDMVLCTLFLHHFSDSDIIENIRGVAHTATTAERGKDREDKPAACRRHLQHCSTAATMSGMQLLTAA